MSVILGSGSPRRLDLLRSVGIEPRVVSPDIDESVLDGELPVDYVRRLASAKLDAVMKNVGAVNVGAIVIAADTTVDVDGVIFGTRASLSRWPDQVVGESIGTGTSKWCRAP